MGDREARAERRAAVIGAALALAGIVAVVVWAMLTQTTAVAA
jgi:hypothetical protein